MPRCCNIYLDEKGLPKAPMVSSDGERQGNGTQFTDGWLEIGSNKRLMGRKTHGRWLTPINEHIRRLHPTKSISIYSKEDKKSYDYICLHECLTARARIGQDSSFSTLQRQETFSLFSEIFPHHDSYGANRTHRDLSSLCVKTSVKRRFISKPELSYPETTRNRAFSKHEVQIRRTGFPNLKHSIDHTDSIITYWDPNIRSPL